MCLLENIVIGNQGWQPGTLPTNDPHLFGPGNRRLKANCDIMFNMIIMRHDVAVSLRPERFNLLFPKHKL